MVSFLLCNLDQGGYHFRINMLPSDFVQLTHSFNFLFLREAISVTNEVNL